MEAAIQGFFLRIVIRFRYTWEIPVGGLISSKAAGCMSAILVEVGSIMGVSQVFCLYYCVNGCFGGTPFGGCFIILSTLFILTYMEGEFSGKHSSWVGRFLNS